MRPESLSASVEVGSAPLHRIRPQGHRRPRAGRMPVLPKPPRWSGVNEPETHLAFGELAR